MLIRLLFAILLTINICAEEQKYKIGAIVPLSGDTATLGTYIQKGILLAYNEFPQEIKDKYEIVFEDGSFKRTQTLAAYQKLAQEDVSALMVVGSTAGNLLAPLVEKEKTTMIAVGASDYRLLENRNYSFLHWVTPEVECEVMLNEIKRKGYKRIGLVGVEQEGFIALYNTLKAEFEKQGVADLLVIEKLFLPENNDFRAYITQLKSKEVDGIIVGLFPGVLSSFTKQARQMGYTKDFIGIELFEDENEVKAAQGSLDNQWYINADIATDLFTKKHIKEYGEHPGWASANGYDSLKLIINGIESNGKENLHTYLENLKDYQGAAGKYSASGDHRFTLPAKVKVVAKNEDGSYFFK